MEIKLAISIGIVCYFFFSGLKRLRQLKPSPPRDQFTDMYLYSGDPLPRHCRVCGCSDFRACWTESGPCYWIEYDLCSACATEDQKLNNSSALNNAVTEFEPGKKHDKCGTN